MTQRLRQFATLIGAVLAQPSGYRAPRPRERYRGWRRTSVSGFGKAHSWH